VTEYILNTSASSVIAAGKATINIGPQLAREQWSIDSTTCTSLGMTITVLLNGQVIDSTLQDPRPTATDNTKVQLMAGQKLTVTWDVAGSGVANGTQVTVTVTGRRRIGGTVPSAVR
jgi:hypothetical protein